MTDQFANPKQIADAGERIYKDKFQAKLEETAKGKFVAINVGSGSASIGDTPEEALGNGRNEEPRGVFHLIRIGFPAAFQLGYAFQPSPTNRLP
jgi:hypothetical protein